MLNPHETARTMAPINLPALFPIVKDPTLPGLPVLVDMLWYGQTMTSPNGGIIHSNSLQSCGSDDSLCL